MTRMFCAVLLLVLAGGLAAGQGKSITLNLKSGETLDGKIKLADEDGLKLDIGDGIELYIRWTYTRGDKHFDLRKGATDFSKIASVLKLADFCHDFAMDEQEYVVLTQALKIDPHHKEARERLLDLPKVAGVEVPPIPEDKPLPPPVTDKPPTSGQKEGPTVASKDKPPAGEQKDTPEPSREPIKITVEFLNNDAVAVDWFKKEFARLNYKIGSKRDHDIHIKIDLTLTLQRAPTFMRQVLYAMYDGTLTWQLYKNGEKEPFASDIAKSENIRRNTKAEAINACRSELMSKAMKDLHAAMQKAR